MKKSLVLIVICLIFNAGLLRAESVDLNKVNEVFASLLNAVIVGDPVIKNAELKIDTQFTVFDKDRAKLVGTAVSKTSAWMPGKESSLDLYFQTEMSKINDDKFSFDMTASMKLKSDILALVKYAAAEFVEDEIDPADVEEEDVLAQVICDVFDKIKNLKKLEDLYPLFRTLKGAYVEYELMEAEKDREEGFEESAKEHEKNAEMAKLIVIEKVKEGDVFKGIKINCDTEGASSQLEGMFDIKYGKALITENDVEVSLKVSLSVDAEQYVEYLGVKQEVINQLKMITGDEMTPEMREELQFALKMYVELVKAFITGEESSGGRMREFK